MSLPEAAMNELEEAAALLFSMLSDSGLGLFVTADGSGTPHATWMATAAAANSCEVVTLTSPDSRKVSNIAENPHTEWMFADDEKSKLVYLNGCSEIVSSPEEMRRYWAVLGDKDRAYFLDHYNTGMGFAIVLTRVSSASIVYPRENRRVSVAPIDLWALQQAGD